LPASQPGRPTPAAHRQIRYLSRARSALRRFRLLRCFGRTYGGAAADSAVWAWADGRKRRGEVWPCAAQHGWSWIVPELQSCWSARKARCCARPGHPYPWGNSAQW